MKRITQLTNYQKEENEKLIEDIDKLKRNNEKMSNDITVVLGKNAELEKEKNEINRKNINIDLQGPFLLHKLLIYI